MAWGEPWIRKQLQGCRGRPPSLPLWEPSGCRPEPPVTPAPLPMLAPPPQHKETTGSALPLSLISRPSADSPVPRKGVYRPGHLCPSRLGTRGQAVGSSEWGRGRTHTGLMQPPPPSTGALGVLGRTTAPGFLTRLHDTQDPPAPSPTCRPSTLHGDTVHLGWPPRAHLESGYVWEGRSWEAHFRAMSRGEPPSLFDAPLTAGGPGSPPCTSNNSQALGTYCAGPSRPVHASWAPQPCQPWWQRGLFSKPKDRPSGRYLALRRQNVISRIFLWIIRTAGLARKF